MKTSEQNKRNKSAISRLRVKDYVDGVLSGNRTILARAITLIESNSPAHKTKAQQVLQQLINRDKPASHKLQAASCKLQAESHKLQATSYKQQTTSYKPQTASHKLQVKKETTEYPTSNIQHPTSNIQHPTSNIQYPTSIRIGITGAPGVGKSTFIDAIGTYLCNNGYKVAVLTVDPTSSLSKGSILGDKTRMENLAKHPNSFIRPSPSGGTLGGVSKKTRESIIVCEAAGFDIIIVETIGVGQSEIAVRSMVDFFLLMLLPGGGDELQGFKKGSVELADAIIVNKADGDNLNLAEVTKKAYEQAIHYMQPATEGWHTRLFTVSAIINTGISDTWSMIEEFYRITSETGIFQKRRNNQLLEWTYNMIDEQLKSMFYNDRVIKKNIPDIERYVLERQITPVNAVDDLLEKFIKSK